MANKLLYREDVLQMLFTDSDENDDRTSNDRAFPGTSLPRKARVFTKHKQVILSTLCSTGMGVAGVDVVLVSIGQLLLSDDRPDCAVCSDRAHSKCGRQ